jgi:putative transposase
MTTIGLSYSLVKRSTKCAPALRLACAAFCISETCYRYQRVNDDENAAIADMLVDLTEKETDWGFGLCFHYLRNVKGFGWNHCVFRRS